MIRTSLIAVVFAVGCSDADAGVSSRSEQGAAALSGSRSFVDARSYWTEPEDIDAWYLLTRTLRQNFDAICGDTFCEGDYANYESLGFRCSVDRAGVVGTCMWMFAASIDEVVPRTGEFSVRSRSWQCPMPLARRTRSTELLRTLTAAGSDPLFAPLPGTTRSLYDGLVECL